MQKRQKIQTFLMFSGQAEEAMNFYVFLFPDSKITEIKRYGKNEAGIEGSVHLAQFTLQDQAFLCIDSPGKHDFNFTPSMSLYVTCENEKEIDRVFESLSHGGKIMMPLGEYPFAKKFAWVSDRFGVSWQLSLPV